MNTINDKLNSNNEHNSFIKNYIKTMAEWLERDIRTTLLAIEKEFNEKRKRGDKIV